MYFGHKHIETGQDCSHELATFLKYHMPLKTLHGHFALTMSSKKTFHSVCENPVRKEKHGRGSHLRSLMEKQKLVVPHLPKGIKICATCRKECRNLDL